MKKSQLHKIIKEELQAVKEAGQVNPELRSMAIAHYPMR